MTGRVIWSHATFPASSSCRNANLAYTENHTRSGGRWPLAAFGLIENTPDVDALVDLRAMYLGPDHLVVTAKVAFEDDISADRAEDVADAIDRRLASRLPLIPHVFLDPTQISSGSQ